jgi:hypothetical protein
MACQLGVIIIPYFSKLLISGHVKGTEKVHAFLVSILHEVLSQNLQPLSKTALTHFWETGSRPLKAIQKTKWQATCSLHAASWTALL